MFCPTRGPPREIKGLTDCVFRFCKPADGLRPVEIHAAEFITASREVDVLR